MSLPAMQQRVAAFTASAGLDTDIPFRALDLASETGELAKEVLKATAYGHEPFTPTDGWPEELADTLFALLCLANSTSVNLETALDAALAKYAARLAARGEASSGH
jgi:NTP pyrophosphatase (non-canonical NTP hydrolase)